MGNVLYRKDKHIAYIILNRPENLNAINRAMTKELSKIWVDFRDDNNLWVAILRGEGKSFCAGADVKEIERGGWKFRRSLLFGDDRIAPSSHQVWKPIIAAVRGHVYGAGFFLFLESDIRIASEDAKFGIPEARVNIPCLFAPFISDYIPGAIAAGLFFTGKPIDAQKAYDIAIVNEVVSVEGLMSRAESIAEEVCRNGPLANWGTKELWRRCRDMDYTSALALVEHIATPIYNARDSIEGKKAFVEKRNPQWKVE